MEDKTKQSTGEQELEVTFNRAAKHFAGLVSSLPADDLLYFYAHYKQATEGECLSSRPGLFNVTARRKWDAWKRQAGVSKTRSMQEYIDGVRERDPEWTGEYDVGWARVSRMPVPTEYENEVKTDLVCFLDAVRSDDVVALEQMSLETFTQEHFEEYDRMTGLHLAADRGLHSVASLLLRHGALVDGRDTAGQTPLHYAASCGHAALVKLLLSHDADITIIDEDGLTPAEVADVTIKELFK